MRNSFIIFPTIPPHPGWTAFFAASRHALLGATLAVGLANAPAVADEAKVTAAVETQAAVDKTKQIMDDSWITTQIKSQILADGVSRGFQVSVETLNGAVLMKGSLGNQDAIDHVHRLAEKVKGVNSVSTAGVKISSQ